MNYYIHGYRLPGNIEKDIFSIKKAMFKNTNDPSWVFFPSVLVVHAGTAPGNPDSRFRQLSAPVNLKPPEKYEDGFVMLPLESGSAITATAGYQPVISGCWLPLRYPGIPLGFSAAGDSELHFSLPACFATSFFPASLCCWEWELSEKPWQSINITTVSELKTRKEVP